MDHPDGSLWHADLQIGDSHVMIGGASDEWPEKPSQVYLPKCGGARWPNPKRA